MNEEALFPAALQAGGLALLARLETPGQALTRQCVEVRVEGERLSLPYRIYCSHQAIGTAIEAGSGEQRALALCLGSRHWDGQLREECLRQLIAFDHPWVSPFIVQPLGEYVIEIVELIAAELARLNAAQLAAFARDNPGFLATTRRRAVSYWDCYHRARFPKLRDYPALAALDAIEAMG